MVPQIMRLVENWCTTAFLIDQSLEDNKTAEKSNRVKQGIHCAISAMFFFYILTLAPSEK